MLAPVFQQPGQLSYTNTMAYPVDGSNQAYALPPPSYESAITQQPQPGYPNQQHQAGYPNQQQQTGFPNRQPQPHYPNFQPQLGYPTQQPQPGY